MTGAARNFNHFSQMTRVVGRFYRDKHFSLDESKRSDWLNTHV
jgi:hypothetical protein